MPGTHATPTRRLRASRTRWRAKIPAWWAKFCARTG